MGNSNRGKNNSGRNNSGKSFINLLAIILIIAAAIVIVLNWILVQFDISLGSLNNIVGWLVKICYLIGFFFLALYAYGYINSKSGKNRKTWLVIYIIAIIILVVFLFLGWF